MNKIVVPIPFKELPLSDDFMFGEVMRRPKICKLFLEALLGKKIAKIKYITKQKDISDSFISHGIRLDIYLRDEAQTVYCVEMQTTGGVVLFKRIQYYQGTMDRHNLKKGDYYTKLPESFIIMVCKEDLFGYGLAVYERQITMKDCGSVKYDDGSHVFILNSNYETGNADKAILEFLDCIRKNDTNSAAYSSELMGMVCPAVIEVRNDM